MIRIQLTAAFSAFEGDGLAALLLLFYGLPWQVKVISVNKIVLSLATFDL